MEKKKRHPNWIDIVFVVLIAAVALTAYWLSHNQSDATEQVVSRTYVLELTELEPAMAESIQVGDKVIDNVKNYDIGVVTGLEIIPAAITVLDEESGVYRLSELPGKVTALVTIEADTLESVSDISTVSGYSLRVGTRVSCTVGELTASGYILSLER